MRYDFWADVLIASLESEKQWGRETIPSGILQGRSDDDELTLHDGDGMCRARERPSEIEVFRNAPTRFLSDNRNAYARNKVGAKKRKA